VCASPAAAGCYVYAGFMSTHENTYTNVYLARWSVCTADSDSDGFVTALDPMAFSEAYVAQAPAADLNGDSAIGAADVLLFQEAYTCGCGTP
jgi:hypothetical protein